MSDEIRIDIRAASYPVDAGTDALGNLVDLGRVQTEKTYGVLAQDQTHFMLGNTSKRSSRR